MRFVRKKRTTNWQLALKITIWAFTTKINCVRIRTDDKALTPSKPVDIKARGLLKVQCKDFGHICPRRRRQRLQNHKRSNFSF